MLFWSFSHAAASFSLVLNWQPRLPVNSWLRKLCCQNSRLTPVPICPRHLDLFFLFTAGLELFSVPYDYNELTMFWCLQFIVMKKKMDLFEIWRLGRKDIIILLPSCSHTFTWDFSMEQISLYWIPCTILFSKASKIWLIDTFLGALLIIFSFNFPQQLRSNPSLFLMQLTCYVILFMILSPHPFFANKNSSRKWALSIFFPLTFSIYFSG